MTRVSYSQPAPKFDRKKPRPERVEQVQLVARVRHFHPDVIIFAVPNGGLRDKRVATRLKAEGVLASVPDLVIAEPRGPYHGLYIEMKRVGGKATLDQAGMMNRLRERGYCVMLAYRGVDQAFAAVEWYLALPPHCCGPAPVQVYTDDSTDTLC